MPYFADLGYNRYILAGTPGLVDPMEEKLAEICRVYVYVHFLNECTKSGALLLPEEFA